MADVTIIIIVLLFFFSFCEILFVLNSIRRSWREFLFIYLPTYLHSD